MTGPFRVRGFASVHRRRWEGQPGQLPRWPQRCPVGSEERLPSGEAAVFAAGTRQTGELSLEPLVGIRGPRSCPHPSTVSPSALPPAEKRGPWAGRDARLPRLGCAQPVGKTFPEEPQGISPSRMPFPAPRCRIRFPNGSPAFRTTPTATCALPRPAPSLWAAAVATALTRHFKEGCPPGHAGTLPQDQRLRDVWPR